jgi:hypothetical protein
VLVVLLVEFVLGKEGVDDVGRRLWMAVSFVMNVGGGF